MGRPKPIGGLAGAVKVLADTVKTTFGAGVVTLSFFGITLIALAAGGSNLPPEPRVRVMLWLIVVITGLLIILLAIRLFRPSGLGGPPDPKAEGNKVVKAHVPNS